MSTFSKTRPLFSILILQLSCSALFFFSTAHFIMDLLVCVLPSPPTEYKAPDSTALLGSLLRPQAPRIVHDIMSCTW